MRKNRDIHKGLCPLAMALFAAFSPPAQAQEGEPARLKATPILGAPAGIPGAPTPDAVPVFIHADRLQGIEGEKTEAFGNVELRKRDQRLSAEHLIYFETREEVFAEENVRLEQNRDRMEGPELRMQMDSSTGYFKTPAYQLVTQDGPRGETMARGKAAMLYFDGQDKYKFEGVNYTTCAPGQDDWFVNARELYVDRPANTGTAWNAWVEFKGVPILYTPWINFPLRKERKTGFLSPSFGSTGKSGAEFALPFYWNIAPNYDATITPRYITKRGLQLNNEFRYLEKDYAGQVQADLLPSDNLADKSRHLVSLQHGQRFANGWNLGLNLNKASDDDYFRDLNTNISQTSVGLLLREGALSRSFASSQWGNYAFVARSQRYQVLQDPSAPIGVPYDRSPQLTLNGGKSFGIDSPVFNIASEYVSFLHPTQLEGRRAILNPSVSWPLVRPYGFVTPKVGVHYTKYNLERENNPAGLPDSSRTVPLFSLDGGLFFEREWQFSGRDSLIQTLEPRIYYVYAPFRDQSLIPNFDTGVLDFNFGQLFTENRFSGGDRFNDANHVTLALTSRLLSPRDGSTSLSATIGQRYYFQDQRVVLPGEAVRNQNNSDLVAAVSGQIAKGWTLSADWQQNSQTNQTDRFNVATVYRPETAKILNAGYRFTRNSLEQIDVSGQWAMGGGWHALGRWNWSLFDNKLLEALGGLEYNAGCWAARFVMHRLPVASTATGRPETIDSFFVQLELNGVSQLGSNPLELLNRNIPGYVKSNELPQSN
jgi:LPS-assembly protein